MKALAIANQGIEKIAAQEIKELIQAEICKLDPTTIQFKYNTIKELETLCAKSQSLSKVIQLFFQIEINSDFENIIIKIIEELDKHQLKYTDIKIDCKRVGQHDFKSVDISHRIYKHLREKGLKINFKTPKTVFFIYIYQNNLYFGIDISRIDLSKRNYKLFTHQRALNSTLAYAMLRSAEYSSKDTVLDPFCGTGTIPIECAIYLKNLEQTPRIYAFDSQFRHIRNAKKNAAIAHVEKDIVFEQRRISKIIAWLEKGSIDLIVTDPPIYVKRKKGNLIRKIYKDFLFQSDIALKPKGRIILISKDNILLDKEILDSKFKMKDSYHVYQGKERRKIMRLSR